MGPVAADGVIYQRSRAIFWLRGGIADTARRKVWAFCGDGEMDEPELARSAWRCAEKLDNLILAAELQPAAAWTGLRSNGKIIQELSGVRGG